MKKREVLGVLARALLGLAFFSLMLSLVWLILGSEVILLVLKEAWKREEVRRKGSLTVHFLVVLFTSGIAFAVMFFPSLYYLKFKPRKFFIDFLTFLFALFLVFFLGFLIIKWSYNYYLAFQNQ